MVPVPVAAGVYLALATAGFAAGRAATVRAAGVSDYATRNARRGVALLAWLAATGASLALGVDAALADWLRATLPGLGPDVYPTAAALALLSGPVPAVALATYLGGVRTGGGGSLRNATGALQRGTTQFASGYAVVAGPALAALALAPAVPDGWWLVGVVGATGAGVTAATPFVVRRLGPTRPLTDEEQARLGVGEDVPVVVMGVRSHVTAMAAGLVPGARAVFVTEALLDRLPPAEAAAIVTHEVGHHRRGHVPLRVGAVAAFVLPWLGATAADVPGAFALGAALAVPYVLGTFALVRRTEYAADAHAAREVGPDALAGALRRLREEGLLAEGGGGRLGGLLALHPPVARRIERLESLGASGGGPERVAVGTDD